jgi:ADP-ribose pyrophosphatase YjhB (NUDIX family)
VEPGESPAAAVVREVREETGLEVEVVALLTVVDLDGDGNGNGNGNGNGDGDAGTAFSYAIHEFLCTVVTGQAGAENAGEGSASNNTRTGELRPGDDAEEACWASPTEVERLGVAAAVREVIALGRSRLEASKRAR